MAAAYGIYFVAWLPYQCEVTKKRVQTLALRLIRLPPTATVVMSARSAANDMNACVGICRTDVDTYMTIAACDRTIGQIDDALLAYQTALRYDRRPEIFLNIGLIQLQTNKRQAALLNLTKACLFNVNYVNEIPNLEDRAAVLASVRRAQESGIARAQRTS